MRIFLNSKIRNVSIVLTIVHFLVMIYTPGFQWSSNPSERGFWIAAFSAISTTLFINWALVMLLDKKKSQK